MNFLVKREQRRIEGTESFKKDKERLNLQENLVGTYECQCRIQGEFPMYLPFKYTVSKTVVENTY